MERISDLDNYFLTPDKVGTLVIMVFSVIVASLYALLTGSVTAWFISGVFVGVIVGQIQTWLQMHLWMKKAREEKNGGVV